MDTAETTRRISTIAREIEPKLIQIRRMLHQIPELAFEEVRTASFIVEFLQTLGKRPRSGIGKTGIVVDFAGTGERKVGFRVDMDGLPITEKTEVAYASKNPGKMHACGHDVHMTIGLGVAHVLQQLENHLPGGVRLLFQPAEEVLPGGAVKMIAGDALDGLAAIYGIHVDPTLPAGQIGLKHGPLLASVDTFEIEIIGRMGHAAHPQHATDAVLVAANVVNALHSIASRRIDPLQPVVISVTTIHGGNAKNILPETVTIGGTYRTLDQEVRQQIAQMIEQTVAGIVAASGASYRLEFQHGSPALVNDDQCIRVAEKLGREVYGGNRIKMLTVPRMGAEDFANYLEHIPGAMLRLGTWGSEASAYSLHAPQFNVDESAIAMGVEFVASVLYRYLAAVHHDPSTKSPTINDAA